MYKILFAKYFPAQDVQEMIGKSFRIRCENFIETDFIPYAEIKHQIPQQCNHFIVTSYRSAKHIIKLELNGKFYCVGKKTETFLVNHNKEVYCVADSAKELLIEIEKKVEPTSFIYFCSDIRLDVIPRGLKDLGYQYSEIITYRTTNRSVYLAEEYDAYVFFSPSGVKSFERQYTIPKKATIFAIGKTTSDVAKTIFNRDVVIPENPDIKILINTIKDYFHAKK